jgi:hypothetical protein
MNLDFPCTAHAFFPERFFDRCHDFPGTVSEICTTFDAVPLSDSRRNLIRPDTLLQIKGRKKIRTSSWMCEMLHIDTQHKLVLLPLNCATTSAVQMAAPIPKIMDTPSYTIEPSIVH